MVQGAFCINIEFFENIPTSFRASILIGGIVLFWVLEGVDRRSTFGTGDHQSSALEAGEMLGDRGGVGAYFLGQLTHAVFSLRQLLDDKKAGGMSHGFYDCCFGFESGCELLIHGECPLVNRVFGKITK